MLRVELSGSYLYDLAVHYDTEVSSSLFVNVV